MKKLFLILVSVLLLGGCSVDDDISVSGGGVSSGGDDMAITTYPNVVEASRTVVEGGYLVKYRVENSALSLVLGNILEKLGVLGDRYDVGFDVIRKSFVDLSFWTFGTVTDSNKVFSWGHIFEIQKADLDSTGSLKIYFYYKIGRGGEKEIYCTRNGIFSGEDISFDTCTFTIFEPSK